MASLALNGIVMEPLRRIKVSGGDVLHGLKCSELGFHGFGEAYFSMIEHESIKGWKKHKQMTLNLIVPIGLIKFIFISEDGENFREEVIGENNYVRLTVPPKVWFGFKGLASPYSLLLNIANIEHEPEEIERRELNTFTCNWGL